MSQMFSNMRHCFLMGLFDEGIAMGISLVVHNEIRDSASEAVRLHEGHGDLGNTGQETTRSVGVIELKESVD